MHFSKVLLVIGVSLFGFTSFAKSQYELKPVDTGVTPSFQSIEIDELEVEAKLSNDYVRFSGKLDGKKLNIVSRISQAKNIAIGQAEVKALLVSIPSGESDFCAEREERALHIKIEATEDGSQILKVEAVETVAHMTDTCETGTGNKFYEIEYK